MPPSNALAEVPTPVRPQLSPRSLSPRLAVALFCPHVALSLGFPLVFLGSPREEVMSGASSMPALRAVVEEYYGVEGMGRRNGIAWWDEIDGSEEWQRGIFYALSVAYSLVSLVALVTHSPLFSSSPFRFLFVLVWVDVVVEVRGREVRAISLGESRRQVGIQNLFAQNVVFDRKGPPCLPLSLFYCLWVIEVGPFPATTTRNRGALCWHSSLSVLLSVGNRSWTSSRHLFRLMVTPFDQIQVFFPRM